MHTNYISPVGKKIYYLGLMLVALQILAGVIFTVYVTLIYGLHISDNEMFDYFHFIPTSIAITVCFLYLLEVAILNYIDKYYNYPLIEVTVTKYLAPGTSRYVIVKAFIGSFRILATMFAGFSLLYGSEEWINILRFSVTYLVLSLVASRIGEGVAVKRKKVKV